MQVQLLGREDPGGGNGNPELQYSCLKKSHGQRSLVGYSPWGHKKVRRDLVASQQRTFHLRFTSC